MLTNVHRFIWRSTVFIVTLVLLYLAFPILIVPSGLPAIKAIIVDSTYPSSIKTSASEPQLAPPSLQSDTTVYQLEIPLSLTFKQKLQLLKAMHQQGIDLMLGRN